MPPQAPTGPQSCANCRKPAATLRCGICRKKSYCDRNCQKLDWAFHKRICEKPKDVLGGSAAAAPPAAAAATSSASASSASAASSAGSNPDGAHDGAAAPAKAAAASGSDEVELDEEDLAAIADVRKKGYAHHARTLDARELDMIGSIAPRQVVAPAAGVPAAAASAAAAAAPGAAAPAPAAASSGPLSKASEWNTSGNTVEEKDLTGWARARLKELLRARASELVLPLPGVGWLEVTGVTGWAGSTAGILISRGKARYILDMEPSLGFLVELVADADVAAGVDASAGAGGDDVSHPLLLSPSLALRDEGDDGEEAVRRPADGAAAPGATEQQSTKRTKLPRAIVRFPDVTSDAASAAALEARVEWGKPAVKLSQRDMVAAALRDGGVVDALRRVVLALVAEFRTK